MENKTSRYIKYAIGEIVLVVIGILIALQINTWNINRINSVKEKGYLLGLQNDLSKQVRELKDSKNFSDRIIDQAEIILAEYSLRATLHEIISPSSFRTT